MDALKDRSSKSIFFKIYYDNALLKKKDIESMARLIGLQVYSIDPLGSDEESFIASQEVELKDDIDLKEAQSHMDILNEYKDCFNFTDEEYELAKKIIEECA